MSAPRPHRQKITDRQIAELRSRYRAGGVTVRVLAAQYGVSGEYVSRVIRGYRRHQVTETGERRTA